jgi:hypothetical protein
MVCLFFSANRSESGKTKSKIYIWMLNRHTMFFLPHQPVNPQLQLADGKLHSVIRVENVS